MHKLSIRKYAKTIGVSHWTVGKAIRAGHIKKGFDKKTKKINTRVADKEWGHAAGEKHKGKLIEFEQKQFRENGKLIAAFSNYCKAFDALLNVIGQEFEQPY
jgi:hypothetical protein